MEIHPAAASLILLIMLVINIIASLAEAAFEDLNDENFIREGNEDPSKIALIDKYLDKISKINATSLWIRLLSAISLGFFVIRPLSAALCEAFGRMDPSDPLKYLIIVLTWIVIGIVYICFFILIPERIADKDPDKWAKKTIYAEHFFAVILTPLTAVSTKLASIISTLFGVPLEYSEEDVTEEDIKSMVNEGHEQGILEQSEAEMISNIFEFDDKEACDIMTHRKNITAIDIQESIEDASDMMLSGKYSRYPVYQGDLDNIVGILYFKDVMRVRMRGRKNVRLSAVMREPYFVPETQSINSLFKEMQKRKVHMAIVIDEYGQTAGVVAMEDILEEIVGNILDEYDIDVKYIRDNGDGSYIAKGMTPLSELADILDISFSEDEFDTLNGFMISRLEHIPEESDHEEIIYEDHKFRVIKARNNMIQEVYIERYSPTEEDKSEEE